MKFYEKYRFLKRTTRFPKEIFIYSQQLGLKLGDIDFILKFFNFIHFENINPNLQNIADRSGISKSAFQSSCKKLKEKGYLNVSQNRISNGSFSTNIYDFGGLFEAISLIQSDEKQLSLNFNRFFSFGKGSSTLESGCTACVPRVLDFFQKDLGLSSKESILLKYLFGYLDDNFISEVSLNIIAKTTSVSRGTLTSAIKGLSDKGLVIIKEQFVGYGKKIRYKNRYDLKPLLEKLNEMERQKVENKLRDQGVWKDYNKERKHAGITVNETIEEEIKLDIPVYEKKPENTERIYFLQNEIYRLKPTLTSKYSEVAALIREYEQELNELRNNDPIKKSLAFLVGERMRKISMKRKEQGNISGDLIKARKVCDTLGGNWRRNRNFYMKSIELCPNTVDRHVVAALDNARKSKENYFGVCMAKKFKKIEQKS